MVESMRKLIRMIRFAIKLLRKKFIFVAVPAWRRKRITKIYLKTWLLYRLKPLGIELKPKFLLFRYNAVM